MQDPEIIPANNVFRGVVKEIRGAGNDKPTQHPRVSPEDQCMLKHSAAVRTDSLKAFVSKVWSDIQLHFEHAGEEGNQDLKPESFILKCDKVGEKYSTMNKETTNHEGPTETEKSRGFPCMRIPEMRSLYTAIPLWENQLWKTWPLTWLEAVRGSTCILHQPQPENHCYAETVCGTHHNSIGQVRCFI